MSESVTRAVPAMVTRMHRSLRAVKRSCSRRTERPKVKREEVEDLCVCVCVCVTVYVCVCVCVKRSYRSRTDRKDVERLEVEGGGGARHNVRTSPPVLMCSLELPQEG